jgi:hypothetical protein
MQNRSAKASDRIFLKGGVMGRILGLAAWVALGVVGLFSVVDLGFGPIVICPQCGSGLNVGIGVILIALSVAAIATNRTAAAGR